VLKDQEQRAGQTISTKDAVAAGFDNKILEAMAGEESFNEVISRLGLKPAAELIGQELRKQPAFFDPVSGKFDMKAYQDRLAQVGMTPDRFEAELADEIAQQHLDAGLGAGLKTPLVYAAVTAGYTLEARTFSYFVLDPRKEPMPSPPTDQQLQQFINQNADKLMRPEMRTLTVVRFSTKTLAPSMPVDPAAVQKLYDFRKDSLSQPEKRSLVEIPAKDAAAANAVAARLKAGQSPDAAAKSIGSAPIAYTDQPQTAIADPKVAAAAFAMQAGQVSGPIQGGLGLAVVKLNSITPAKVLSLDEVRPQLEQQVRTDAATAKVYDAVQKYDDTHGGGSSLADSARAAGGTPVSVGPVTAQGADLTGRPVPGMTQRLLQTAFALPQGGESDLEDEGGGEYFAVRVEKIAPPALPTIQEVKVPLTQYYLRQTLGARLQAKADALAARVRKGESLEAVAASAGASVAHQVGVTRQALVQNQTLGQDVVGRLLSAKKGDVVSAMTPQLVGMVVRLDSILPPAPADAARTAVAERDGMSNQIFQDFDQSAHIAARNRIKPITDLDRARTAIGLDPSDLPKSSAPAAGSRTAP
jgi:peptidyl-prolyl cis-trans isomerase D